ncbi:MAG TPA: exodeoxyribonuclease VII small subunit [Burkholderiaceae bacterium]
MAKAPSAKPPVSYESALQELEQLISQLESGQLPLEQLLTAYQRGAELLAFCRGQLDAVDQQIRVLDEGTLKPWTAS